MEEVGEVEVVLPVEEEGSTIHLDDGSASQGLVFTCLHHC